MKYTIRIALTALLLSVCASSVIADTEDSEAIRLGKQLYRQGLLADGQPSQAVVQSDVVASGTQFTCVSCHQRSGLGTSEGGKQTPAVTGAILFAPIEFRRREFHETKIIRPAYNGETLSTAIRSGVSESGDVFDPLMPRYSLSDQDMNNLIAYLKSLSSADDPGVTDDTVHFATIIAGPVAQEEITAVQNVSDRFVGDKNALTRQEDQRAANAPWHKDWVYESFRKWQLHTWTITGDPSTWSDQLQNAYEEQAVFAVIGGLGDQDWEPISTFCRTMALPCILPNTLLVPDGTPDFYNLYFNAGIDLEARVLAKHIKQSDEAPDSCATLQVHDASLASQRAATVLAEDLTQTGQKIETLSIDARQGIADFDWHAALDGNRACRVVLWLAEDQLGNLETLQQFSQLNAIYLSSSLVTGTMAGVSDILQQKIRLIYPYQLQTGNRLNPRLTGWAQGKKIELTHKRLQANTFYSLSLVADAMQHIRSNFSRDYFLERIEHMVSRMLAKPAYDGLTLAPGQRYLSKGAYVVMLPSESGEPVIPVSDWIVP
jgi:cytochrome c553